MKTIVVPINFSENSANAARYAADLAVSIGAEIRLLHVFQVPMSISEVPIPETAFEGLQDSGQGLLDDLSRELFRRTRGKVPLHCDMETGVVERQLEQYCRVNKPLLVVMGATGGGLENALTGSSSVRALRYLPYPVIVVPRGTHFQRIRKVVIACDPEDLSAGLPAAAPVLQLLGNVPDIRLEVAHVLRADESASEFMIAYQRWKGALRGLQPSLRLIRAASFMEGMNEILGNGAADLMVIFPKKHRVLEFHRSRARQLVLQCQVPVMSVHAKSNGS
jgi:nucleotide-binding universal stress UspA family protein